MKIKTKILWASLGISVLVAFVGALAVQRQHLTATMGATQEAENVARLLGVVLLQSTGSPSSAQELVTKLNRVDKRDIVLVDTKRTILADAVASDVGKTFAEDASGAVEATLKDRRPRIFVEKSDDSPLPIKQVVVSTEDSSGHVVGAVILEYTPLYDELMQSTHSLLWQVVCAALLSVLASVAIAFYLGRSIAVPLQQLTSVTKAFASGRSDLPMPPPRRDEIGELAGAFTHMMQKREEAKEELRVALDNTEAHVADRTRELEVTYKQLMDASRLAGMAEVATGVLHNVGNVLNSVNVSADLLAEKVRRSKAPKLAKAAALLTAQNGNLAHFLTEDPNGQTLPGYLAMLGEHLIAENEGLQREVDLLRANVEHIKEVVAMQQSYAKLSGVFETLPLDQLVEDALVMNYGGFERHGVTVERRFSPAPPARVDRHKVLQILINLIRNAKYALDEVDRPDKLITISIESVGECVRILVADNGVGILKENLDRIFGHGFTTRRDGHGFGLHSGANAAREIGGALSVQSDGAGRGATFTLELPAAALPLSK